MNNFYKKTQDLSEIFDKRWKVNNKNKKKINESKKEFRLKMYKIKDKEDIKKEIREANSVSAKVERLNKKIEGLRNLNRNNFR